MSSSVPPTSLTDDVEKPAIISWYKLYAGVLVFLAIVTVVTGGLILRSSRWFHGNEGLMMGLGGVTLVAGLISGVVAGASIFFPRKKWAYIAHIAIMAMSMSLVVLIPVCIPLLLRYNKPDVKSWYDPTIPEDVFE
jgi:hypothetical protein